MIAVRRGMDVADKLAVLSRDSRYDLACACCTGDEEHRRRSNDGRWIYPVVLPSGQKTFLLKTLMSNVCVNQCKYCPLRAGCDPQRCSLSPEELAEVFFDYHRTGLVSGLFVSSGVIGSPDATMERINRTAMILRQRQFTGFIHLKVIPGASDAAVAEAVSLASAVSVNIEAPGERHFDKICTGKNYLDDVIRPIKLVSRLTAYGERFGRVKQTTQFVVGASDETDRQIVDYSWGLYKRLGLQRVYFSAYQRGLGEADLPGERAATDGGDMLTREHRLYQVDWLIRRYGFAAQEIPFEDSGHLSLGVDPKQTWADRHPEFFPVDVNRADKLQLLRVPGLGEIMVEKILKLRRAKTIRRLTDLGKSTTRLTHAATYLKFPTARYMPPAKEIQAALW